MRVTGKKRRKVSLSTAELKALARMVVEEGVKPRDAALVFNVKPTMVWSLVRKVKAEELAINSIRQK